MVGKKINNYELRELVGDGAMGVVYLAEHPVLRRRAAVKLLKRQYLESPSLVARFVNEARAAAAIHHPNVIEVIDVGMMEDEVPYIMMEFLEGEPLSRRLTRERIGIGKAVDIAIQSARALSASHALEIVHRDLKPENLFLVPDPMSPGGERVKVLDFGIAKLRPDWGGSDGPKTRTGVIFGTPAYMSPEQCRGLNDEVDGSTDVYALGCILFEMLCGRAPYISQGWGDVLMMHMSDEIPLPSKENPRVPSAIDQVVKTALAKKKTDRYASMRDMHRALAQARNDVEDTPAPLVKTDPALAPVLLGVDALAGGRASSPAGAGPASALASGDAFTPSVETFGSALRRRFRSRAFAISIAGGIIGVVGLTVALWPRSHEAPTPAAQAPESKTPQAAVPVGPGVGKEPAAGSPAQAVATPAAGDDSAGTGPGTAKSPEGRSPEAKSPDGKTADAKVANAKLTKLKTAKSNHRLARRKDPVKW
jgi:serine/threonine protein kinase